jgi:hypothetical protein
VLGHLDGRLEQTVEASAIRYTDAKSGQVVYAHHTMLERPRAEFNYLYAAVHDEAKPEFSNLRSAAHGRAPRAPRTGSRFSPRVSHPPKALDMLYLTANGALGATSSAMFCGRCIFRD